MYFIQDFTDGVIADNILRGLRLCTKSDLTQLKNDGLLTKSRLFPALDYRSLTYKGIETYVDLTGLSLSYFLFGTHTPPTPTYTPNDGAVINLLNALSEEQLDAALAACDLFFPGERPHFDSTDPSERLICCLNRLPYANRTNYPIPPYKKIENDVHSILQTRFSSTKGRNIRWFPTDLIPDLATYVSVSLYWVFGFERHPLFCKTAKADKLFSRYTLLPPEQHHEFLTMIKYFLLGSLGDVYDIL